MAPLATAGLVLSTAAGEVPEALPDPDGRPGASDGPLRICVLSGRSNMVGTGTADKLEPLATGDEWFGCPLGQRGSHVKFARQTAEGLGTAIVPGHREVAVGALRSIPRQAGISPEDFEKL